MLKVEVLEEVPIEEYFGALVGQSEEIKLPEPDAPAVSGEQSPTQEPGDTGQQR